jgi:hypothetical protein
MEFVRQCTHLTPADRPGVTELQEIPWIKEEQPAYDKMLRLRARPVPWAEGWKQIIGKGQSVGKASARMILRPNNMKVYGNDRGLGSSRSS